MTARLTALLLLAACASVPQTAREVGSRQDACQQQEQRVRGAFADVEGCRTAAAASCKALGLHENCGADPAWESRQRRRSGHAPGVSR